MATTPSREGSDKGVGSLFLIVGMGLLVLLEDDKIGITGDADEITVGGE